MECTTNHYESFSIDFIVHVSYEKYISVNYEDWWKFLQWFTLFYYAYGLLIELLRLSFLNNDENMKIMNNEIILPLDDCWWK